MMKKRLAPRRKAMRLLIAIIVTALTLIGPTRAETWTAVCVDAREHSGRNVLACTGSMYVFEQDGQFYMANPVPSGSRFVPGTGGCDGCRLEQDDHLEVIPCGDLLEHFPAPCHTAKERYDGVTAAQHNEATRRFCGDLFDPDRPNLPAVVKNMPESERAEWYSGSKKSLAECISRYSWTGD
jgi:hypothetical protein